MKVAAQFFFILTILLWCPHAHAQQALRASDAARVDIEKFTKDLLENVAVVNEQKDAAIKQKQSAVEAAEKELEEIATKVEKAKITYDEAQIHQVAMWSRKGSIADARDAKSIDRLEMVYQDSSSKTNTARRDVENLERQEDQAKRKLQTNQRELESARQERDRWATASAHQRTELKKVYDTWASNVSDVTFKALTGQLTAMAAAVGQTSEVDLVTKKGSQANPGALIKYESELDRKNKAQPIKSANCSTGCTEKGMPKGWYYMWSERDQRETSDKNRYIHIKGPKDAVEIIEN